MIRQAKVMIYGKDIDIHKILSNNGIVLDGICTEAYATEELSSSGNYYSDYKFTNDGELSELLKEECILKVLLDYGYEIFQINKVTENLKDISVVARQYTIPQQLQLWLHDVRPTNMSGNTALNYMINNAKGDKNIVVSSDITTGYTSYYQLMNFYEACFDCNQSFEKRWGSNGLETKRRGNHIYINKTIGGDRKLSIVEGKNLKGFKVNRTSNDYITRGIGIGFNGLKGNYIDSPLINNYKDVHTGKFKYDDVKLRTKDMDSNTEGMIFDTLEEVQQELDRRVALEFSVNHVDTILAEYTLDYVKLEDTIEYEDNNYSETEKANVGDYVRVKVPTLNYDLIVRVVEKKYDILTQRTKSIKLSNFDIQSKISTSQVVKNITSAMKSTNNDDMNRYVTAMIEDGLKNSHVIIRPDEILILDTKDINTAKNVWRWNKGALAHTTSGYYSKDWNIGILQTGEIVADQILTGTLSTVTIKPLKESESNMFIDLSTGNLFMDRGKIGSNEFYLDITKQKIVGNNMTIDFPTGRIEAQHGRFGNDTTYYDLDTQVIKGNASNLNLKDGVYSFADGNVVIDKDNGIKVLKGKIGNDSCYFDVTNQHIKGDRVDINLKDGTNNLLQAGTVGSTNGRTNLNLNNGTAKIGNFSVGNDNKVQVSDGSFTAKEGDKYCKVESSKVSWEDGSRLENHRKHSFIGLTGYKELDGFVFPVYEQLEVESIDLIGNKDGGASLSSKGGGAFINACSNRSVINYDSNSICIDDSGISNYSNGRYSLDNKGETRISSGEYIDIYSDRSIFITGTNMVDIESKKFVSISSKECNIHGNLKVTGDKNCIQHTEEYGDIKFSCVEDFGSYLTWREYDAFKEDCIYETKKSKYSKDDYYSCIVKIPKIVQETIDTTGNYNVELTKVRCFGDICLWSISKEYFLVKSEKPCKFNFVLTGRRKGFEYRSIEEQILEAQKYQEDKQKEEQKLIMKKAKFTLLGVKRDFRLWEQCGLEWQEYGMCYEG